MNTNVRSALMMTVAIILAGCGTTTQQLARMNRSERTDIFTETATNGPAPAGYADVLIRASLKTPLAGDYLIGSKRAAEGDQGCSFLINIDGQAALWTVSGQQEAIPLYDESGKTSRDPDAGVGIKYHLEKKIRLAVGLHKIAFGVPEKDYVSEFNVSLREGESQVLEFRPQYRYKTIPTRIPTFFKGIDRYEAVLNGQVVSAVLSSCSSYDFTVLSPAF